MWDDSEETIMKKCKLSLVYMEPGKYGEFIPIKKPTEFDVTTENIPKSNTNKDKTSMPGPDNVSTENNTVATENDGTVSTENTSKDIIPSTSSVEKNPLGMVNTGNDLMSNVPNVNVHTENTGMRVASQNHQPRPNLVEMVRAAELKKTTENTGTSGTSQKRQPQPNLVNMVRTAESNKSTRHMRAHKHINYADLNTGIDSEPDYSPPRKKKCDIVTAIREPSQTVISAHWQHITRQGLRKMFPSPEHKTLKLVGTVIISPPVKTLLSNKEIKQEDDWLKLPKNIPTDTRSLMDLSVNLP